MSSAANYASSPRTAGVVISTANTNRDGTGTLGVLLTASSNGTRIDRINIQALSTTTAGMVRFFVYDGATYYLWREVPVVAKTPSGTETAYSATLSNLALLLQSGWSLRVGTNNAEAFAITATFAGDF